MRVLAARLMTIPDECVVCVCLLAGVSGTEDRKGGDRLGSSLWFPSLAPECQQGWGQGGSDTQNRYRAVIRGIFSHNPHPFHCIYMRHNVLQNRWLCIELFDTMSCVVTCNVMLPPVRRTSVVINVFALTHSTRKLSVLRFIRTWPGL